MFKILLTIILYLGGTLPLYAIDSPSEITATPGNKKAEIYWSAVPDAVEYDIYRTTDPSGEFSLAGTSVTGTFMDEPLLNETKYYYYITATDGADTSEPSQTVTATPISKGVLSYYRWSDWIYFYNTWMLPTDGDGINIGNEIELLYTENQDDTTETSGPAPQISKDKKWAIIADKNTLKKYYLDNNYCEMIVPSDVEKQKGFSLSPDDTKIVYVKKYFGKYALYICDNNGGNEELFLKVTNKNVFYPSFSFDGQTIVYVSDKPGSYEIYTIDVSTKTTTRITNNSLDEYYPKLSPDGSKIAFHVEEDTTGTYEIYTVTLDNTLTNFSGFTDTHELFPAWSNDGSKLAFIFIDDAIVNEYKQYYFHIVTKNSDGTGNLTYLSNPSYKIFRSGLDWREKPDVMPPRAVIDLEFSNINSQSVTITFTAPGDDGSTGTANKYYLILSESPINSNNFLSLPIRAITDSPNISGHTESMIINNLKSDTTYYIALYSEDELSNRSKLSNIITGTTSTSTDTSDPFPPDSLITTPKDFLKMELAWDHSLSNDTAGYKIYRNSDLIGTISYTNNYADTAPAKNVSYSYKIIAFDENGNESGYSNEVSAISKDNTIPPPPEFVRSYNLNDKIVLRWEPVNIPDIQGYQIYRQSLFFPSLIGTVGNQEYYEDNTGSLNTEYTYYIKTIDTAGNESSYSEPITAEKGLTDNKRVLVIVNSNSLDSIEIGEYYKTARNIPSENVLYLDLPNYEYISKSTYETEIQLPVRNYLTSKIHYIVTTKGVPINAAVRSVDSLLADVYNDLPENMPHILDENHEEHDYFLSKKRFSSTYNMILTSRLDGPTVTLVKSIIDKSIYAEQHPDIITSGNLWLDARNLTPSVYSGSYAQAERFIKTCGRQAELRGLSYYIDNNEALFPENFCSNTFFYYGWYSFWNFKEIFDGYLNIGSIAGHLDSASFQTLHNTGDNNWGIHLLERGATAAFGAIVEPTTKAFPCGGLMLDRFFKGFSLAESYWLSADTLNWVMILIGDPIYNPFSHPSVPEPDNDSPAISNIQSAPFGFLSYSISWDTDEITEHAVEYYHDINDQQTTGYLGWFSKDAHIVLDNLEKNTVYYFRVKSRDPFGNETVSTYYQFTYADIDNDGLEDSWELSFYPSLTSISGYEDSDDDGFITFKEFDLGYDPLIKENFNYNLSDTSSGITWLSNNNRKYQLYYDDTFDHNSPNWQKAGPLRSGTNEQLSWTDDGRNTGKTPQDESVEKRIYRLESSPISR